MDQNKNAQGQPGQGQKQGQQNQGQKRGSPGNQNWNRDQAEGSREQTRGGQSGRMGGQERGTGNPGERNSSGTSNRGMSERDEQADLPSRGPGNDDSPDQSER